MTNFHAKLNNSKSNDTDIQCDNCLEAHCTRMMKLCIKISLHKSQEVLVVLFA